MKNCIINLEKWTQKIFILIMLLISIPYGITIGYASDDTVNAPKPMQINLPDGLYLFQSKIIQMYKYRPEIKDDVFSPLLIVKNGKLLDPYSLAKKIGIQKFMKEYVTEKTFSVFVGTEMIGKLSGVKLKFFETNTCPSGRLLFDIEGTGTYEGRPLPGRYEDKSVYVHNNDKTLLNQAIVKAVAVPQPYHKSKKNEAFILTEDQKAKVIKDVREKLVSEAMKPIEARLNKEHRIILREDRSRLDFIKILNLENSGKKDHVGVYTLYVSHRKISDSIRTGVAFNEILFILWDSGKIEKILFGMENSPAFSLGGLIDIDQNGVQELIVQSSSGPYVEDDNTGKKIEIFQHDSSGWKSIYRSALICSQIN